MVFPLNCYKRGSIRNCHPMRSNSWWTFFEASMVRTMEICSAYGQSYALLDGNPRGPLIEPCVSFWRVDLSSRAGRAEGTSVPFTRSHGEQLMRLSTKRPGGISWIFHPPEPQRVRGVIEKNPTPYEGQCTPYEGQFPAFCVNRISRLPRIRVNQSLFTPSITPYEGTYIDLPRRWGNGAMLGSGQTGEKWGCIGLENAGGPQKSPGHPASRE